MVVLCVVESIGSSPGRAGFKMAVTREDMYGSIGGGSMEHKLVELARSLLEEPERFPFVKRQVHQADLGADRSGMICSGEQTVAFHLLWQQQSAFVQRLMDHARNGGQGELELSSKGMSFHPEQVPSTPVFEQSAPAHWRYREPVVARPRIAIVGGGHVSLALSRTMAQLGFHVHVYEDRNGLNTLQENVHADARSIVDYDRIADHLGDDPELFIVLATFGYRTDERVLRRIIRGRYRYLGMLGSAAKVSTMFDGLRAEGFTTEELSRVHAPVGLPINSRTPEEIAVSIAAEIIRIKNT